MRAQLYDGGRRGQRQMGKTQQHGGGQPVLGKLHHINQIPWVKVENAIL